MLAMSYGLALAAMVAHSAAPAGRGSDTKVGALQLKSAAALVVDQEGGRALYAKNVNTVVPIASITKLMTAMVVLDSGAPLGEAITITAGDADEIKGTHSRLKLGATLSRADLLRIALMASENRAAAALGRTYPGGMRAFVAAMNQKAEKLEMWRSRFVESTGLSSDNVSTADDLAKMVMAAYRYPLIREYTTSASYAVRLANGRMVQYRNTNRLILNPSWTIGLSKTGYLSEAGRSLVMQTAIGTKSLIIVLLDSWGTLTRIADANRIRRWIEGDRAPLRQRVEG